MSGKQFLAYFFNFKDVNKIFQKKEISHYKMANTLFRILFMS